MEALIPLNQRALGILTFWAAQFPDRKPEHFVFATERYGLDGEAGYLAGKAPHFVDPAKPIGSWKTAWKAARNRHFTTDDLREAMENNFDRIPGIIFPGTHR